MTNTVPQLAFPWLSLTHEQGAANKERLLLAQTGKHSPPSHLNTGA